MRNPEHRTRSTDLAPSAARAVARGLRDVPIGRLAGVPVSVNASVLVVVATIVVILAFFSLPDLLPTAGLPLRMAAALVAALAFLGSLLAHEFGHAQAAKRNSVGVIGVSLWLLGGVARLERRAPSPRAEFEIAVAGPVVNFVLALVFGVVWWWLQAGADNVTVWLAILGWLTGTNLILAVTNLLPGAPLDGGRVLTAILWKRTGDADRARLLAARAGLLLGACLIVGGLALWQSGDQLGGVSVVFVTVFIVMAARSEIDDAAGRLRLARTKADLVMVPELPPLTAHSTVADLMNAEPPGPRRVVVWGHEPIGYTAPDLGARVPAGDRYWTRVEDVMIPSEDVQRGWATEHLATILERSPGAELPAIVVIHDPASYAAVGTIGLRQWHAILGAPNDFWGRERPAQNTASKLQASAAALSRGRT